MGRERKNMSSRDWTNLEADVRKALGKQNGETVIEVVTRILLKGTRTKPESWR
jgi:hypothetical protein